ncbi:hypothetical protein MMC15_005688 [Xylographa vitiligo]|nr:hypothetical protein [Xylographa vitiligo]
MEGHPIHLTGQQVAAQDPFLVAKAGDIFEDRYQIFRKLGQGQYGSVWLAKQIEAKIDLYVALKIGSTKEPAWNEEQKIIDVLAKSTSNHPGKNHVQKIHASFVHKARNSQYYCRVLEPLGRSVRQHFERYKSGLDSWPLPFARELSRQILFGLDCLHSQDIMHRDIGMHNILFGLTYDLNLLSEAAIMSGQEAPLASSNKPSFLGQALDDEFSIAAAANTKNFRAVVIDFGAASTFAQSNDGNHKYPRMLRAPEVILGQSFTEKADLWDLGCLIYHIVIQEDLFSLRDTSTFTDPPTATDDDLLLNIIERIGPMPPSLQAKWARAHTHINAQGQLLKPRSDPEDPDLVAPLRTTLQLLKRKDMSDQESRAFGDFLEDIFQWQPEKRRSTAELLNHPWMTQYR